MGWDSGGDEMGVGWGRLRIYPERMRLLGVGLGYRIMLLLQNIIGYLTW